MMTPGDYFGGSRFETVASNVAVYPNLARVYILSPTGASKTATLCDARWIRRPGIVAYIFNVGANAITLRDNAAATIVSIPAGQFAELILTDNSTAAGAWKTRLRTSNTGFTLSRAGSAPTINPTVSSAVTPTCVYYRLRPCSSGSDLFTTADLSAFVGKVILHSSAYYKVDRYYGLPGTLTSVTVPGSGLDKCPAGCSPPPTFPCQAAVDVDALLECLADQPAELWPFLGDLWNGDSVTASCEWVLKVFGFDLCACAPGGSWTDSNGINYSWAYVISGCSSCGDGSDDCCNEIALVKT
ncbi:MAG: hypothetical protein KF805_08395 [Phycisphaeraceae bacterium]|nr:hypothetical protein [Phycisphaeraceae bacterium]